MKSEILQSALHYVTKGYSVIPINPKTKKPFIAWKEFQERYPKQDEIQGWWEKWPSANVAIVTGKISGICVIDIDEQQGFSAVQEFVPDSLIMPTAKTPSGGQHLYFQYPDKPINNSSRFIPGCDFRGEGGYIIAPPSKGYQWLKDLSIEEPPLPALPMQVFNKYLYASTYRKKLDNLLDRNEKPLKFQLGTRDEDLFHVANCLVKGQGSLEVSSQVLRILAANCDPPFDPKEADIKVKSALERAQRRERNKSSEIREYVLSSFGQFSSRDIQGCLGLSNRNDQKIIWYELNQMVKEGLAERVTERHGYYRRLDKECEEVDFINAPEEIVDINLPFGINRKVEIMPGNIIAIAGEVNAGKTAFLLNVVNENMHKFDIHYFSSEMGGSELKKRLKKFDYPLTLKEWKFHFKERSDNFGDVIVPGKRKINIIDYLELHDKFFLIGGHLSDIHKRLRGAIAIVAIQKNPGVDTGLGGFRGLELPRLYLAMSRGKLKIVKAKNWATKNNPNNQEVNFKIVNGCKLIQQGDWHLGSEK